MRFSAAGRRNAEQLRDKRGPVDQPLEYWHRQADVVQLLSEVERAINALELTGADVGPYRESLPDSYEAVLATRHDWASASNGQVRALDPANEGMLRALAGLLDA